MARRRSSAQRRHDRNIDRWAVERQKDSIWTDCDICGSTFCVNNYSDQKVRKQHLKVGPFIVCSTCRCVLPGGTLVLKGKIDWARRYVQMYVTLKRLAKTDEVAAKLIQEMDDERPRRRLYRKRRREDLAPQEV